MTAFHDPDEALRRIQHDVEAAQRRAGRAQEVKAEIDAVRGRGRSAHGDVTVVVDASGRLRDLELTDAALARRPDALARLVLETARTAELDAGRRAVGIAEEAFGEGSPLTAHLRAEIEQRTAR